MKKTFTTILCLTALLLGTNTLKAQDDSHDINDIFKLGVEARFDYVHEALDGNRVDPATGIKVRYINLRLDGQISEKFTYSWRQRLNKMYSQQSFVDNMDWLYLNYQPTKNWGIAAGKQVVMIGGWEYDRAPIDLYFCSEYWNNVVCYQFGASVAYTTNEGNDKLTLQFCQSPYDQNFKPTDDGYSKVKSNLFAYNLYWMGSHGCYTALHSLNFSEYQRGKFDVYVVLGNQFKFGDATLQLDLMNRGTSGKELLFNNFSIMGEFSYLVAQRVNIFAKATYDKVGNDYPMGLFLYPGTEITRVGGGVEYYPLGGRGNRDVRLHAAYAYNIGNNMNPNGTAHNKGSYFTFGLTWKLDVVKGITTIIDKHQAKRAAKL